MKVRKFSYLICLFVFCLPFACKDKQASLEIPKTPLQIDTVVLTNSLPPSLQLKKFSLQYNDLIKNDGLMKMKTLNATEISNWKILEIDAFYDTQYNYHFIDSIGTSDSFFLALIARAYENENIIWLCTYDKQGKMIHAEEVFYDNAEGNYLLESELKNNILTLQSDDINEGKKSEIYQFNSKLIPEKTESN
ncbi:MAG: hypothetical protein IPO86_13360 [Saprospiraceae bacterium]|nr:hypothetical protein [Saprospiraceae bacterium]MBK9729094.1 hypothetical protein [Saprospiraceae bacterium]